MVINSRRAYVPCGITDLYYNCKAKCKRKPKRQSIMENQET